eukprot:540077_1
MAYVMLFCTLFSTIHMTYANIMQCTDGNCNCPSTNTSGEICTLECTQPFICSQLTINCRPNDPCQIICNANNACSHLTINQNDATDLKITCSTTNACTNTIHTSCTTGNCQLQLECETNTSCTNLSYSSNINQHTSNTNESTFNISNLNLRNPSIIIIIILCILCCLVVFVSSGFNYLYYKTMKRREELLIKQYQTSASVLSPTASVLSPTASVLSPTASNFSAISQPMPTSPIVITLNNDNSYPAIHNIPKLKMQNLVHSNDTDITCVDGDYNNGNVNTYDDNGNLNVRTMHSITYSQLPLSMKQPAFKLRMSNDIKHEPEQEEESISISISRTQSYRL